MTEKGPPKRATLRWPGTRRERRMAVLLPLGAAILVGLALVAAGSVGGGDDSEGDSSSDSQTQIEVARSMLTRSLRDKRQGISARYPADWRRREIRGEQVLESRDRCMAIKLSTPAAASAAGLVRRDTLAALQRGFKRIQIAPGQTGKRIGGVPTTQDVITVQTEQGRQVRILVAVGRGRDRAYLTEFVLRDPRCSQTLLEAQLILNSARFTR